MVHGAAFLPVDALSLYGMKNEGSMLDCATEQYKLWVDTYFKECDEIRGKDEVNFKRMREVGFCAPETIYPGKDDAWLRIKELEKIAS